MVGPDMSIRTDIDPVLRRLQNQAHRLKIINKKKYDPDVCVYTITTCNNIGLEEQGNFS